MKIEVGKFYRTRDGKKAFVYNKNKSMAYPFNFVVVNRHTISSCTDNGQFFGEGREVGNDLVEEWEDSKKMIDSILNLFRKDKIYTYKPYNSASGPVAAFVEFVQFKEEVEKATGKKIEWVKSYSVFGLERIKYKVIERKD